MEGDVPFVARPSFLFPPIAGRTPWTGSPDDFSTQILSFLAKEANGHTFPHGDFCAHARTEQSKCSDGCFVMSGYVHFIGDRSDGYASVVNGKILDRNER